MHWLVSNARTMSAIVLTSLPIEFSVVSVYARTRSTMHTLKMRFVSYCYWYVTAAAKHSPNLGVK